MELLAELNEKRKLLNQALYESTERGKKLAQAERAYKVANAKFILEQRALGTPATLIKDLAMGDETVSGLRLERDIASVYYENAREAINSYKLEARLIEEQIAREWGAAK